VDPRLYRASHKAGPHDIFDHSIGGFFFCDRPVTVPLAPNPYRFPATGGTPSLSCALPIQFQPLLLVYAGILFVRFSLRKGLVLDEPPVEM